MTVSIAQDTTATGGRGAPNAWSPASDSENWVFKAGGGTKAFTGSELTWTNTSANQTLLNMLGTKTAQDCEVLCRLEQSATGDNPGLVLRFVDTNNYYCADITTNQLRIRKLVASAGTTLVTSSFTPSANTFYWIRLRAVGINATNLYAKVWADGSAEPAAWTLTTTDSSSALQVAGNFGVIGKTNNANDTLTYDSFSVVQAYTVTEQANAQFKAQMPLNTRTRAQFYTRMNGLNTRARAKFLAAMVLKGAGRAKFYTCMTPLSSAARARFYTRMVLRSPAWVKFILHAVAPRVLKVSMAQPLQRINPIFSEVSMSNPNTTIDVSATVKDANGALVSNLTVCSALVTFPDGSTQTLVSTNMGSGVYTITYTTKSPGLHRELWSFTDVSTSTAQYLNITPVSF